MMNRTINIAVIGCGRWGPNHVRNFSHLAGSRTLMCADHDRKRLQTMKKTFRSIYPTTDYREILRHPKIDAVVVATQAATHYRLVKEALLAGKDVLCEKPLCLNLKNAQELVDLARRRKRILMTSHVFLFHAGIRKLKALIGRGACGEIYYFHSERTHLGPFRKDVNAAWDLASHDVAIFNYLLDSSPLEVSARGGHYLSGKKEDTVFITLTYPKRVLVHIHASWLSPQRVRQITAVGSKKTIVWNDLAQEGPLKIYNRCAVEQYYESFGDFQTMTREGSITIPKVRLEEPLKVQDAHFLDCIRSRRQPLTNGREGLEVIRVLAAVDRSLARKGAPVAL